MKTQISNMPQKGMNDYYPEEMAVRNYIFSVWRDVCTRFGYKEYLTPLLEPADLYRAKSGEDVGGKELMILTDRAGRELSIRPEMTPSVTRLVSRIYQKEQKPIRLFSIANFIRNEKPQRGRNREFWQLNYDLFGSTSINSDIEIAQVALEIMLSFLPPKNSFIMRINSRKVIEDIFDMLKFSPEQRIGVIRVMDKITKLGRQEIIDRLKETGAGNECIRVILSIMDSNFNVKDIEKQLGLPENLESVKELNEFMDKLNSLGYGEFIEFNPSVLRGFDYYDGIVFEVFDTNPLNNRSMFGGGRYNGLASIFGTESFPAVGCAPGDVTTSLFLESWGVIDRIKNMVKEKRVYIPLTDNKYYFKIMEIARDIRKEEISVSVGVEIQAISKAVSYADKGGYSYCIIVDENEFTQNTVSIRDMILRTQQTTTLETAFYIIKKDRGLN